MVGGSRAVRAGVVGAKLVAAFVVVVVVGCELPSAVDPASLPETRPDMRRSWLGPIEPPRARASTIGIPDNVELRDVLASDEEDRRAIAPSVDLARRDEARRARVLAILTDGGARTAFDYFAVAVVLDHGTSLQDFADARRYAVVAAKLGERRGVRLAAQAWDRWLVRSGHPQRFGTLARCDAEGCRLHVYEPTTTDEERAAWELPPLEVLKVAAERAR